MKKVLIIGGTGILSAAVVDACISHGFEVTMMNRGNKMGDVNPNAKLIICDARDEEQVKQKLQGMYFDVVIDFIVFNLEQLKKSLNLFGGHTKQYVFISSAQVYNTSISKVLEETDPTPQPLWQYSINKDICEKYLRDYALKNHINYTIIRPGVNYDNHRIPYGIVPPYGKHWTIVERILAGKPIITWNDGNNKLNLTRVEDFAEGVVTLLGNEKAYNECYNVVGDYIYSWREVLETLGRILETTVKTIDLPLQEYARELSLDNRERLLGGRANNLVCSNKKLKSISPSYKSTIPLEVGLRMTIDGYKANGYYDGIDYKWDAEQDRIIRKLTANSRRGGCIPYSQASKQEYLLNLCTWKIEYYAYNKAMKFIWKVARKFIYKPLSKLLSK